MHRGDKAKEEAEKEFQRIATAYEVSIKVTCISPDSRWVMAVSPRALNEWGLYLSRPLLSDGCISQGSYWVTAVSLSALPYWVMAVSLTALTDWWLYLSRLLLSEGCISQGPYWVMVVSLRAFTEWGLYLSGPLLSDWVRATNTPGGSYVDGVALSGDQSFWKWATPHTKWLHCPAALWYRNSVPNLCYSLPTPYWLSTHSVLTLY